MKKGCDWKWGPVIGGAGVASFVLTWSLGWHERGLGMLQVSSTLPILIHFVGYVLALGALFRREPETRFGEGVKEGGLVAAGVGAVAALGQALYLKFLDPGWTDRLADLVRARYAEAGFAGESLEEIVEGARSTYGFASSVIQAGIGGLLLGIVFSALIVAVLRFRSSR